jgi:hypothetical protein
LDQLKLTLLSDAMSPKTIFVPSDKPICVPGP